MSVRPTIPTKQVTTPDTGILVTLKERLTYGENKAVYAAVFADLEYDSEEKKANSKVNLVQAQTLITLTISRAITAWDVTEEDGTPIPVTQENIEEMLTEKDINSLMESFQQTTDEKKNNSAAS